MFGLTATTVGGCPPPEPTASTSTTSGSVSGPPLLWLNGSGSTIAQIAPLLGPYTDRFEVHLANVLCFALFVATLFLLAFMPPFQAGRSPLSPSAIGTGETTMTVEPGDTQVELGSSLLVLAHMPATVPPQATLNFQLATGEQTQLSANLNDLVFGGRIPVIDQPLEYWVALTDQTSPKYRVSVFEYPRLERTDAKTCFSRLHEAGGPRRAGHTHGVLLEGTTLTLQCFLNKTVVSATLIDAKDAAAKPIALAPAPDEPLRYEATWTCLSTLEAGAARRSQPDQSKVGAVQHPRDSVEYLRQVY